LRPAAAAQRREDAKVGGQLDILGNLFEIAQHVTARGRSKVLARSENQIDVAAQFVDRAAALERDLAQRMPRGIFKKDIIVAVNAVGVIDITADLGRIGKLRRGEWLYEYWITCD